MILVWFVEIGAMLWLGFTQSENETEILLPLHHIIFTISYGKCIPNFFQSF